MNQSSDENPDDRIQELLADQAIEGLSDSDQEELRALLLENPDLLTDDYDRIAARLDLAWSEPDFSELPEALRARIERDAGLAPPRSGWRLPVRRIVAVSGWLAAAAAWLVASTAWWPSRSDDPYRKIQRLQTEIRPVSFQPTDHPLARGAGGEVVWSQTRQEGYLKLVGLAGVDPTQGAYQLWIFDARRDPRFPIDGGRFTIPSEKDSTVVLIHTPLPVGQPTVFAITLEPPGGVVVSDRRRIMLQCNVEERPSSR